MSLRGGAGGGGGGGYKIELREREGYFCFEYVDCFDRSIINFAIFFLLSCSYVDI